MGDKGKRDWNPEELRNGNLVLLDSVETRGEPFIRSTVEKVEGDIIYFTNGACRKIAECAPIIVDDKWLTLFGVPKNIVPTRIKFVHQLQNEFGTTKYNETECMGCSGLWGWKTDNVFDFSLSTGKRIWPAVCLVCRESIERRYKSGKLNRANLNLEFAEIAKRILIKCAKPNNPAVKKLQEFKPTRRGK